MAFKTKAEEINLVLSEPNVNLWKLRELALTEGGLVNDNLRKRAWPKLVGLHDFYVEPGYPERGSIPPRPPVPNARPPMHPRPNASAQGNFLDDDASICSTRSQDTVEGKSSGRYVPPCLDAEQIERDVGRCTWHLLTGSQRITRLKMENKHRKKVANMLKKKQRRLGKLINLTLLRTYEESGGQTEKLCYYQGYHDVASIFLSTLGGGGSSPSSVGSESPAGIASSIGLDLPSAVLSRLSSSHFRDAMRTDFMQLQTAIRLLLMPLISYFDREVHEFLLDCDMEPFFALSWIITWFSHDIRDTALVTRLFDAFIVSHPLLPLYMTVAMVCHPCNRAEILAAECDFAIVHSTLAALPKNSSMVGWKYRPSEGGYTSGDETDDEINTSSMEVSLLLEQHYSAEGCDGEESETHSLISSQISVGSKGTKVPFQELLDNALVFMRRVPPRKLIRLTEMYFAEEKLKPMLDVTPSIEFLNPHPKWGLISTAPADWVLKQRSRRLVGQGLTRRDRRNRIRSRSPCETRDDAKHESSANGSNKKNRDEPLVVSEDDEIARFLLENNKLLAVIACGFGAGDEDDFMERKRRRIMLGCAAAAIVIISVAVIVYSGEYSSKSQQQKEQLGRIEAGTCKAPHTSKQVTEISVPSFLFMEKPKLPVVASMSVPDAHPTRLRGQPRERTDNENAIIKSAMRRITPKEVSFLFEAKAAATASEEKTCWTSTDVGLQDGPRVPTQSFAITQSRGVPLIDRMLAVLPCPNFTRLVKAYADLTLDRFPRAMRAIGRFLQPILQSIGKKQVKNSEL